MAVELLRLIEKVEHMDMRLVAGEEGIHTPVTWVHMAETQDATGFLDEGHLAFVTGIGLHGSFQLIDLIQALEKRKVAGLVVNTGTYIEKIPDDVIVYCNEKAFPLFVIPWRIHLAEVMRIFCFAITKEEQRMLQISSAMKNAILFPKQEELYVVPLSQHSFKVTGRYSVTIIKLKSDNSRLDERLEELCNSLENIISYHKKQYAIFVNDMEIILVLVGLSEDELLKEVNEIRDSAKQFLHKNEELTMGVGRLTKSIRCLYKSYNQAKSIENLQERGKIGKDRIFYSNLGIYRLLMGIEDHELMQEYYNHTLKPIIDYDSTNNSDLCETLRCYLMHDGSVKETAEELFVHRNTINYKLNKIEELLGIEMSSLEARKELMIAFDLQDIL